MFNNTRSALSKTVSDIKRISLACHLLFYSFGIITSLYNVFNLGDFIPLHIATLVLSALSLFFYLVYREADDKKLKKELKKKWKKAKKARRLTKNVTKILVFSYMVCFSSLKLNLLTVVLTVFSALILLISIVFDLIRWVVERRVEMIFSALDDDLGAMNPINKAKNFISRVRGDKKDEKEKIIIEDFVDEKEIYKK